MTSTMFDIISFLTFVAVIVLFIIKDRKKIKIEGIFLIRRTTEGRKFIEKIGRRHSKLWNIIGSIAVVISIPVGLIALIFLIKNSVLIFQGVGIPGAGLVLPGPVSNVEAKPGVFIFPWWLWLIAIMTIVIPHEFFHGFVAAANKIRIKSLGWVFLAIIPGAFVEPDDIQLRRSKAWTKMKVYAAGSFANFLTGIIFLVLFLSIRHFMFYPAGLNYGGNIKGYPAYDVNLSGAIEEINGVPVHNLKDLQNILSRIPPGTLISIKTTTGTFNLTTVKVENRNGSFIGISGPFSTHYEIKKRFASLGPTMDFFNEILIWIVLLNVFIGIFNLLPLKPLDGGLIMEEILRKYTKSYEVISNYISIFTLAVLVFNIVGPYLVRFL